MKIRSKLILNYSLLSFLLLLLFSFLVVLIYVQYRENDFKNRLLYRTMSSVNMLFIEKSIDSTMLRLIDKNIKTSMSQFELVVFDSSDVVFYSNIDRNDTATLQRITRQETIIDQFIPGEKSVTYHYLHNGMKFQVYASAFDNQGFDELNNLIRILAWVLFYSLLLIVGFGFYNAIWSLKPFRNILFEIDTLEPHELKKRLSINGSDEISQLSASFNALLNRIAQVLETEKAFILNASHELRTPITSVLGQIEVVLNKNRDKDEYRAVLQSVYDDTSKMAVLINGFLNLAETEIEPSRIKMELISVDELLFAIIDQLKNKNPEYSITVEFEQNPENEQQLQCLGNERLLQLMFANIIDNACKYSNDKKAKIKIDFTTIDIIVSVIDNGIGIPPDDLEHIFKPLYRGNNVGGFKGHGIGLAIVKRIADLHQIKVIANSKHNIGTTVYLRLRHLI